MMTTFARKVPTRKMFAELLYAVYNIAPEPTVEPGSKSGHVSNSAALAAANALYDLLEKSSAHRTGVLCVVRLLAETTCSSSPELYAQKEAQRGLAGDRHEEDGASIALPHADTNRGTL